MAAEILAALNAVSRRKIGHMRSVARRDPMTDGRDEVDIGSKD